MNPVLQTDRLTLRLPQEADYAALTAFGQSPRTRFIGGPMDARQAWRGLLATIGHWTLRGYGFFSADDTATGAFVGRIGVIFHPGWQEPELGWHLFDGHEGKGYATEAARAVRDWYARTFTRQPLISYIDPANPASERVAHRLGCHVEGPGEVYGHKVNVWRHPEVPA